MRHTVISRPLSVLLAALVFAVAACGPASGPLGSLSTPVPTSDASLPVPTDDVTPPPPTPTPAASFSTGPSATAAPSDAAPTIIRAYFLANDNTGRGALVPVLREVPHTVAVGTAAINALFAGPSAAERAATPALYSVIPDGSRLLGLAIQDTVATVNLSGEFESGGGSASVFGRLAQVVYTLTQFPTVTQVQFQLDGAAITLFSSEGVVLDHPLKRTDYSDLLPMIFVDRPAWGGAAGNPMKLVAWANVFEAQFTVELHDATGMIVAKQSVMATCGTGCWGTLTTSIPYTVSHGQWGTLRVYDASAKDGSPENERIYPVWLTPVG